MNLYNLRISQEELEALNQKGKLIIQDEIDTSCDNCSEDVQFEIQIIVDKK